MSDVFSKTKRSAVMSRIRSYGNKETELALVSIFRKNRISGWRRQHSIFGRPDFVFPKKRVVVFVDGCFWHYCPLHGNLPKGNNGFWSIKLANNVKRDKLVTKTLRDQGWSVLRVWEHELTLKNRTKLIRKIVCLL